MSGRVPVQYVALENEETQLVKFIEKAEAKLALIRKEKAEIEAKMAAKKISKKAEK